MKALRTVLVVIGVLCTLSSAPVALLPWSSIGHFLGIFGLEAPPEHPAVVYCLRLSALGFALIGVFFLVLATDPVRYGPMLLLAAWGCWIMGLMALATGWLTKMPPLWYLTDAGSCALAAILIPVFWRRAVRQTAAD